MNAPVVAECARVDGSEGLEGWPPAGSGAGMGTVVNAASLRMLATVRAAAGPPVRTMPMTFSDYCWLSGGVVPAPAAAACMRDFTSIIRKPWPVAAPTTPATCSC